MLNSTVLNRRTFMQLSGSAGMVAVLAACTVAPPAPASDRVFGEGVTEIEVWYQDWDGANRIMAATTPVFAEKNPEVTVNLQAIGYADLRDKMLPSIAAGTEGDVMMMYTDWVVATDLTKVFLDLTDVAGGYAFWETQMWPAAFSVIDTPGNRIYYLPWLAGIRGAVHTVNTDHLAAASIDYLNFASYEDLVEAGIQLTQTNDDGKIIRSGLSPRSSQYQQYWNFIWQLGGDFYDKENGIWSHSTPEGEAAAQILHNLYHEDRVCDFELFTSEYEAVSQKLVSIWADGAWTASVQQDVAEVPADNILTPMLRDAVTDVLYPQHQAGWGISRRLADNPDRLELSVEFALDLLGPDVSYQAFEFYSGVTMTKSVYQDPRIEDVKYGLMSKRIAEALWPIARYPQDRVANHGPASVELDRAMRNEISIPEALNNMDSYLQEQENQARERIGA